MPRYKIDNIALEPYTNDAKLGGVYMIHCIANDKKYIGATVGLKYRLNQHRSQLRRHCHKNLALQMDWTKYGEDQFIFSVIEYCKYKLSEKETIHNNSVPENKRYSHINNNQFDRLPKNTTATQFKNNGENEVIELNGDSPGRVWIRKKVGAKWKIAVSKSDLPGTQRFDIRITEKIVPKRRYTKRKP